jgi:hypothetical protein
MQRKIDDEMLAVSAAPTEAPTMARAVGSRTAWRSRGAAIGVIALALSLAACGGSSNNDDPADQPIVTDPDPVAPGPDPVVPAPDPVVPDPVVPPAPVDPTPAGFTKTGEILTVAGSIDVGDTFTAGSRTVVYDSVNKRYYEFVAAPAISQAAAKKAAVDAGGQLASPSSVAKMAFIKVAFPAPKLPVGDDATGGNGAWIGLEQAAGSTELAAGWTFLDGSPLPADTLLWNKPTEPNDADGAENGAENFAAIFGGKTTAETDLEMIYDAGAGTAATQDAYLIEYATKEAIVLVP